MGTLTPSGVRVRIGFEVIQVFFIQEFTVYGSIQSLIDVSAGFYYFIRKSVAVLLN